MKFDVISRAAMYNGIGQAITYQNKKLTVGANDVLIRVKASMFGKALQRALVWGHPKIKPNTVLGTLFAGEVVNDNKFFKKGTRVVVNPHKSCGKCVNCLSGKQYLCTNTVKINPGGIARYVVIHENNVNSIEDLYDEISYEEAVLTEIIACVLESIYKAGVNAEDHVLIAGSGLTSFIHAQILMSMGIKNIDILYKDEIRKSIIESIGAIAINSEYSKDELLLCKRKNFAGFNGYDIVFEAVGSETVLEKCLDIVAPKGKIILFGGYCIGSSLNINLNFLHYKEVSLIGTYHFRDEYFRMSLDMLKENKLDLKMLITKYIFFEDLDKAVEEFSKKECIALIVKY